MGKGFLWTFTNTVPVRLTLFRSACSGTTLAAPCGSKASGALAFQPVQLRWHLKLAAPRKLGAFKTSFSLWAGLLLCRQSLVECCLMAQRVRAGEVLVLQACLRRCLRDILLGCCCCCRTVLQHCTGWWCHRR